MDLLKEFPFNAVKVCSTNDDEHLIMLSLVYLLYLLYVTWFMYNFCYKLHICRAAVFPSSRVVSSMKCVFQVVRYTEHIALYRTIVYCHVTGNIMGCSLRVTSAGVAGCEYEC